MEKYWSRYNTSEDIKQLFARAQWSGACAVSLQERFSAMDFDVCAVKENPKRKVFRLSCADGEVFYLKLFAPRNFPACLFRSYGEKEYRSGKRLEKASLPVIEYVAWGKLFPGSFCLSAALPGAVDLRQYFFESVYGKSEQTLLLLRRLAALICAMKEAQFVHPDFHLGNILYSRNKDGLFLPDPYGITQKNKWGKADEIMMCHPFLELYSFVPETALMQALCDSTLAEDISGAAHVLEQGLASFRARRKNEYEKLGKRILGGRSKYATKITLPGGTVCAFRHTYWYTAPPVFAIDRSWRSETFPTGEESAKIWVDSFLSIPLPPPEEVPLAREEFPDGRTVLYYER